MQENYNKTITLPVFLLLTIINFMKHFLFFTSLTNLRIFGGGGGITKNVLRQSIYFLGLMLMFPTDMYTQLSGNFTPGGIFDKVYDRFGNVYTLDSIQIDTTASGGVAAMKTTNISCTVGNYFHLYFEDNSGMENAGNTTEDARRAVICQVFADLAQFITPANPNTPVNIWIRDMSVLPANALGVASSFYIYPQGANVSGIVDAAVWQTIQSGHDAYENVLPPLVSQNTGQPGNIFFHAWMAFDFNTFPWQTDLTIPVSNGNYDLYAVALHEITHALGFASLIDWNGASKLGADTYYARYDKFLQTNNNIPLIIDGNSCGDMYNFVFNNAAGLSSATISPNPTSINCTSPPPPIDMLANCPYSVWYKGTVNEPVYTPYCYQGGSSLSHFEDMCHVNPSGGNNFKPNNEYYVMSNANGTGPIYAKRHLTPEERRVLCDLGYVVGTVYGNATNQTYIDYNSLTNAVWNTLPCASLYVAGTNDGIISPGTFQFSVALGGNTISIPIATLMGNDAPNVTGIECVESIFPAMGTVSVSGTNIIFTSGATQGLALLRYVPINNTSGVITRGNITYIYIWVAGNCPASACTNMVNNGDFEIATSCGDWVDALPDPDIQCWYECSGSPDLMSAGVCGSSGSWGSNNAYFEIPSALSNPSALTWNNATTNNHFIGLAASRYFGTNWSESIQTTLASPIMPGQSYKITFWARVANKTFPASGNPVVMNLPADIYIAGSPSPIVPISNTSLQTTGYYSGNLHTFNTGGILQLVDTLTVQNTNSWKLIARTFTYMDTVPLYNLIILHGPFDDMITYGANISDPVYIYIDDVSLMPISSVITLNLPDEICIAANLDLLSFVSPPSNSGNPAFNVIDAAGNPITLNGNIFSPSAIGTYTVSYHYLDNAGCLQTVSDQIFVSDNCPDIEIRKSIDDPNPTQGSTVTYTIQLSNIGQADATNVVAEDILPICLEYVSNQFTQCPSGTCSYNSTTGMITIPTLAIGEVAILEITATYNCGNCPNTAKLISVAEGDEDASNNIGTVYPVGMTPLIGNVNSLSTPLISGTSTAPNYYYLDGTYTIDPTAPLNIQEVHISMAPGAEIIVPSNASLFAIYCVFQGCTQMWKGIHVAANGIVNIQRSTIRDAQYGVYALPNSTITLSGCMFNNNYMGVNMAGTGNGQNINHSITGCTFQTLPLNNNLFSTQLLPAYSGQTPVLPNIPLGYAGIHSDWINLVLNSNRFYNLNIGIDANMASAVVTGNSFDNIRFLPNNNFFYNPQFYTGKDGSAIYIRGSIMFPQSLKLTGSGNAPSSPENFKRCDKGVHAIMSDVTASKNRMTMMTKGFVIDFCKARNIQINNNRIHAYHRGVSVRNCVSSTSQVSIDHNYIEAGKNLPFLWQKGEGILVQENNATYPLSIFRDTIVVNKARYGIDITGKKLAYIYCNIINPTHPASGHGIGFSATNDMKVSYNLIQGINPSATVLSTDSTCFSCYTMGLRASLSTNGEYQGNTFDNTRYGARFLGDCNGTRLRGNDFNRHKVGLQLTPSAVIGHQGDAGQGERFGNKWQGPFALRGAQHDAALVVNPPATTPTFVGQSTIYYATLGAGWSSFNQTSHEPWYLFEFKAGNTYVPPFVACGSLTPPEGNGTNPTDIAIASNSLDPVVYREETIWMLRRGLYEKLAENDTLLQDSLMAAFYSSYDNTNFVDFYSTQEGMKSLGKMSEAEQAQVNAVNEAIAGFMQNITDTQIQLGDSTISSEDSLLLMLQISDWKEQIQAERASVSSILAQYAIQSTDNASTLQAQNAQTATNAQYELNEKIVNEIYLATVARENYTLSPTQQVNLLNIAYQCPLAGGKAVYLARNLYSIYTDSIQWDDDSLCVAAGMNFRQSNNIKATEFKEFSNISLYPNPASQEVTVIFHYQTANEQKIILYDIMGKEVSHYLVTTNKENYVIKLSNLPSGVYTLKISGNQQQISTHKLIIAQ